MTLITPDLIEKAAKAAFLNFAGETPSMQGLWDLDGFERKEWVDQARATLQAIIPDVVASCAAVADIAGDPVIAAEIRSLIPQEGK